MMLKSMHVYEVDCLDMSRPLMVDTIRFRGYYHELLVASTCVLALSAASMTV